ncbi:hypothetical protein HYFRA_00010374 [Hymenoscyphus fraxineus]|uniref:Dioxygenase n=1 Tax=Hymenoscyphus fraxineus TaxID=746836 RepID=A0A9N9L3J5_9HELO|nr:hypothetical protein HYFRA_00010374 [Hymenoscyphus fraxineus]
MTPSLPIRQSGPKYGVDKSQAKYDRAVEIIKERLPTMGFLKGLLVVNLGGGRPDIIIDARGEPKLLEKTDEEPDTKLNTKSDYIIQFYNGALEPRYGLFKDAFFHEASLPQGNLRIAIKFADALCPVNPSPPKHYDGTERLPKPTEDLEQVKSDVREFGYGLVKNALTPEEVEKLSSALKQQAAGETKAGVSSTDGGPNAPNQRIWTLINKGQEFVDLLEHPLIEEIVPEILGEQAIINSYTANIARPGNVPMQLHTDQVAIQPPIRDIPFGLNIMWFLTDVTKENGGTRVFPGSHIGPIAPDDIFDLEGSVAAEGPAGTALVFESRIWHATGPNRETSGERPVIMAFFFRSFLRQQENNFLSIRKEVEENLSDKVKALLGYRTTGALGGVEGEVREGIFVKKVANPIGPFRDA